MIAGNSTDFDLASSGREQLLLALTQQLKAPFLHISQHVELVRGGHTADLNHLETIADISLRLIDSYLLSGQLFHGQLALELEPVSVSSILHKAAENLRSIAREYNCELDVQLSGRYGPVMAHRPSLEAAMTTLGYSFIEAAEKQQHKQPRLTLAAHKNHRGIVAGVYGENQILRAKTYRKTTSLDGQAQQPLASLSHAPAAGILVADALFSAMASRLAASRHSNLNGLAATFLPSPQLRLI